MKDSLDNIVFSEILNGYSVLIDSRGVQLYIKHLSYLDTGAIDSKYNQFLEEAIKGGIPKYKDREEFITKEKLWTTSDEIDLNQYEKMIKDLNANYSTEFLYSRRLKLKEQIDQNSQFLSRLKIKKNHYIGNTAEQWASNRLLSNRISASFFSDESLTCKVVNDDLEDSYFDELFELYHKNRDKLGDSRIKRISLSSFFTNIFYLCADDAYNFYGKPIIKLTDYQINLFAYGRYFKHILSQREDIPKDVMQDPDEILDWIELRNNAEKAKVIGNDQDNKNGGGGSIIGATKEDYKRLGIDIGKGSNALSEALKKKGGTLKADDLMKMES